MKNAKRSKIQTFVLQFVFTSSFSFNAANTTYIEFEQLIPPNLIASQDETLSCTELYPEDPPPPDMGKYAENKTYYERFLILSEETQLSKYLLSQTNRFKNTKDLLGSKKMNSSIYRIDINLNTQGNILPVVFKDPGFQPSLFKGRITPSKIFFGKTGYFELSAPF